MFYYTVAVIQKYKFVGSCEVPCRWDLGCTRSLSWLMGCHLTEWHTQRLEEALVFLLAFCASEIATHTCPGQPAGR